MKETVREEPQYLQFDPGVEHRGENDVSPADQLLEVSVQTGTQRLAERDVVGDEALEGLVQANQGGNNQGDGHSVSLQDLQRTQINRRSELYYKRRHPLVFIEMPR